MRYMGVYRLCDNIRVASYGHNNHPAEDVESKIAQVLSANAAQMHPRLSVADRDIGMIHYETSRYAMYVSVTVHDYPQRVIFKCLAELRGRFEDGFGDALHKAEEGGLSKAACPVMVELCTKFADATSVDKTLHVIKDVDEVWHIGIPKVMKAPTRT